MISKNLLMQTTVIMNDISAQLCYIHHAEGCASLFQELDPTKFTYPLTQTDLKIECVL